MTVLYLLLLQFAVSVNTFQQPFQPHAIPPPVVIGRVIGGTIAEDAFAPYMVSVQRIMADTANEHICGGAIISERYVLTAGHCFPEDESKENFAIVTGTNNLRQPHAIYYIEEIFKHCNYNKPRYHNDIAMLRLNESIIWNNTTKPVKLPYKPMEPGDVVRFTGWGVTDFLGDTSDVLQKINLIHITYEKCLEMWKNSRHLSIQNICTQTKHGEGACIADSGGPLVTNDNYLVGIALWVHQGCADGTPDVHLSTLYFSDWINTILSENEHRKTCRKH